MIYTSKPIEADIEHILEFDGAVYLEETVKNPDETILLSEGAILNKENCITLKENKINRAKIVSNPNIREFLLQKYTARYDEDNLYEIFGEELKPGMVLRQDIYNKDGTLIYPKGTILNLMNIIDIKDTEKENLILVYISTKLEYAIALSNQSINSADNEKNFSDINSISKEDIIKIARTEQKSFIPSLVNLYLNIFNTDDERLQTVVWALGFMKAEQALPAFFKTFEKITNETVLEKIIWAFGEIKNIRALVLLKRILKDINSSVDIKWAAVFAIKSIGPDKEISILIDAFKKKILNKAVIPESESRIEKSITIKSETGNLKLVREYIKNNCNNLSLDENVIYNLILCVDESVMNVIEHNYKFDKTKDIKIEFDYKPEKIIITVTGGDKNYDISKLGDIDVAEHIKERRDGGLGVYFCKKYLDNLELKKDEKGLNKLILTKNLKTEEEK